MSQHIIAISWNHHQSPLDFRDKLALSRQEIQQHVRLSLDRNELLELAVLSTCNRIEFYAIAVSSIEVLTYIKNLYNNILKWDVPWNQTAPEVYSGIDAVCHLYRVAAGMESMVLGEKQILSQVQAVKQTLIQRQMGNVLLSKLFNAAVVCAETVRTNIPLFLTITNISELAVITAKKIYNDLEQRVVLILGAGETAALTARNFKTSGIFKIIIANRSEKRGRTLAESIEADYIDMRYINDIICECDIIVTATHSRNYLIKREQIENIMSKRKEEFLLLDISTPRNIDPSIYDIVNVYLYDLDHFGAITTKNRKKNKVSLEKAEMIIQKHSQKLMGRFNLEGLQESNLELIEAGD